MPNVHKRLLPSARRLASVVPSITAITAIIAGSALCPTALADRPAATSPSSETPKPAVPQAGIVDLRPRFLAGRQTRYVLEIESSNALRSASTPDLDQDQKQKDRITLAVRVKTATPEGATVEIVYERVEASLKTPDMDISADSAAIPPAKKPKNPPQTPAKKSTPKQNQPGQSQPPTPADLDAIAEMSMEDMLLQHVKAAAGTTLSVTTDAAGNIVSLTGGENLSGNPLTSMMGLSGGVASGSPTAPQSVANWVLAGIGAPASVRIGQSWTTTSNLAGTPIGSLGMQTTSTLKSMHAGIADIAFAGTAQASTQSGLVLPGFQLKHARYTGTARWDARTEQGGELAGMDASTEVAISGNVAGMTADMTSTQRVRVTRK